MGEVNGSGRPKIDWLLRLVCVALIVACLLGGYALEAQAQTTTRGFDLGAPSGRPPNIYGVNVHLLGVPDSDAQLLRLRSQGFGWVRQEFDWQSTVLSQVAALATEAQKEGLGLVAVLTGPASPDPVAFAAWSGDFAARFHDQIDYYQIWDEPNLGSAWNGQPNPAEYARLLQAAFTAIHAKDPTATVMLAGLAPTVETGPKNLSDVLFLRQLYELGAQGYFDAVGGKPYGFNTGPDDRTVDPGVLNFSRLILLREEMLAHGDATKLIWGSNFGWNTRPSIWGQVTGEQQQTFTRLAYQRAANEWQWAGPMFLETPRPAETAGDPHGGFALPADGLVSNTNHYLIPGTHQVRSLDAYAIFDGAWKFSDLGVDIPQNPPAKLTLSFTGTALAITVRRADYRAYLYATIDGRPANALPEDSQGQAYVILTSPDLQPRVDTIDLARGLAPGPHTLIIQADRGWDQWALVSFTVGPNAVRPDVRWPLAILIVLSVAGCAGLLFIRPSNPPRPVSALSARLSDFGQTLLTSLFAVVLWASAWLTWGGDVANTFRRYGDTAPLIVTILTAGLLYYSPFLILTILSLVALFVLFYLRPVLALPLIAFFIPFYLIPRLVWDRAFSMVEICTVLAVGAVALRSWPAGIRWLSQAVAGRGRTGERAKITAAVSPVPAAFLSARWLLDIAVLGFVIVSGLAAAGADVRGVAIREFRVIVLEPAFLYLLLRFIPLDSKQIWRIVDFLIIGAVVVAAYGLSNLLTGENLITAEGGLARIKSVFGSPNNVGLFLGRTIPVAAALVVLGKPGRRRILYGLALLPTLAAAGLSFSRGALVFGLPAALAVILVFWGGWRAAVALASLAGLTAAALVPLSRIPRFADLFSTSSGTGFFRVNVWRSAWAMFVDHPLLGVGLDNFLYAYRGRYIQPAAWQEPNLPHAHNIFLDALTRTGLLGLAALLALLGAFFIVARTTLRQLTDPNLRALAIGLLASLADCLAHGLVDTGYWFVDLAFVFMLTLGLISALSRLAEAALLPEAAGIIAQPQIQTE